MTKTIWWVEHGGYSDYGIDAVFSSKAVAEAAAKAMNGGASFGGYVVASRIVYDEVPQRERWFVKEFFQGKVSRLSMTAWPWDPPSYNGRMTRGLGFHRWGYRNGDYRFWGKDEKRVNKAFDDYHAQQLAIELGIADGPMFVSIPPDPEG